MRTTIIAVALLAAGPVLADEASFALRDAPGRDAVEQNCGACHSLDYVEMNSPFLDQEKWAGEVKKMRAAYGAPISDQDADTILAYLVANYGK